MLAQAEFEKPIQIFDLDGTLTIEFDPGEGDRTGEGLDTYSYWHRITRKIVPDPEAFDAREKAWIEMVIAAKDIDMVASLIERTKTEIRMFAESDKNDAAIRRQAALITRDFFSRGILELDAIRYLEDKLRAGITCVISTGGDESGTSGFVDGLVSCGLLPEELASKIIVSGTRINWDEMAVEHLNVGALKLRGLELAFQKPIDDIQKRTQAVFGNDPDRGDRALLYGFCQHGFVKKTVKNEKVFLPPNCVFFSSWAEIYDYRNRISELHTRLKMFDMPKIIAAIVTPRNNGVVDAVSLANLIQFQINNHVAALLLLGTTGEFNKMSLVDKKTLIDEFYKIKDSKQESIFLMIGISAKTSTEMLDIIEYCAKKKYNADAFVVAPLFGEGDPEEKVRLILQHTTAPVMLYNNPAIHGGANIPIELVKKFIAYPQIIGIKDSSGSREYFNSLLLLASTEFHIYQGAEDNLINDLKNPKLTGIISGSANIVPLVFYNLVKGINVDSEQKHLLVIKSQLAKYPNYIQGLKAMLCNEGILVSADTFA